VLFRLRLKCSFCGKSAAQVAKLVAGRRGYICDVCAAEAHRIMSDRDCTPAAPAQRQAPSIRMRIRRLLDGHTRAAAATAHILHRPA
jgi:ATP-dependent protease Clp ATPase subunit